MALYLVLLCTILPFSLGSTEQYVSSLDSMKNTSGRSITKVDTMKENPWLFSENVDQTEQIVPVHDTSMSGAVQPTAASTSTSTSTATTPSSTTTTMTTTTNTSTTITTTTTTSTTTLTPSTATTNPSTSNSTTNSTSNTSSATTTTITITTTPYITITTTTTITTITTPKTCPHSGYEFFPEFGCYKIFSSDDVRNSWSEARATCRGDGGDLMVVETEREKTDVFNPLYHNMNSIYYPWVGVYIPQGEENWITVKGEPVPSTWWLPGMPDKNATRRCATAHETALMRNWDCEPHQTFICEIAV